MTEKPTYEELQKRVLDLEKLESRWEKVHEELDVATSVLERVSEHAAEGVCSFNGSREHPFIRFTLWNKRMQEITGYSIEQVNSRGWYQQVVPYPFLREKISRRISRMFQGEGVKDEEWEIIHSNGKSRTLLITASILKSKIDNIHALAFVKDKGDPPGIVKTKRDYLQRGRNEQALTRRINFERLIYNISYSLVGVTGEKIDEEINRALASIAEFTGTDRAYVFEFRDDTDFVDNTYEWCAENVDSQIHNLQNIYLDSQLPCFSRRIRSGKIFNIPSVAALPSEAVRERKHFESQNIKSLIVVPMASKSQSYGFLGFDAVRKPRTWTDDDQLLLNWVGNNFAKALERKYWEKLIRESQEQLDLAIRGTNAGLWDWHVQTGQAVFNRRWAEIIGYSLDELEPISIRTWIDHCHPDDVKISNEELEKHFTGEKPHYTCECRMRHKSGSWIWVSDRGKVVQWDDDGKPLRMVGTHIDITEKKHYEAVIQAERSIAAVWSQPGTFKERLAACLKKIIQESSMDSGGFYRVNEADGSLVLEVHQGLSDEFVNHSKYFSGSSLNARLVREGSLIFTLYEELVPFKKDMMAVEGLKAVCVIPVHFQGRAVACLNLASHSMDSIEKFNRNLLTKISDYLGSFIAHELMEEKNRQARQDMDTLFNTIQDMVFILDFDGNILFSNSAANKKLGYAGSELAGKNISWVHPPDRHQEVALVMSRIMKRETEICPIPLLMKNGDLIPVETLVEFGRWKNQDVIYGISRNITERQKMAYQEKQIAKDNSLKLMAGSIAHNFNNILAAVIGFLELALMEISPNGQVAELVNEAFHAAKKATDMSKLMLTYVGQSSVTYEMIDLPKACRNITGILERKFKGGISLETDFPSSRPIITVNENQLHQILEHLLTNSVESFGDGGGSVFLSIKTVSSTDIPKKRFPADFHPKEAAYACIEVKDTGHGIPDNHIENLFDPFFSTKFTGRGLGLPAVLGIMRQYDGMVSVESKPSGTVFSLFFPLPENMAFKEME